MIWAVTASMVVSVGLMVAVGILGPSAAVPAFPSAAPWPPYFTAAGPAESVAAIAAWLGVALGGAGLVAALLAARRGWRPQPRRLLGGCLLAVVALLLIPPTGSTDMLDYAVYGRIAVLGHSPYQLTPARLAQTGDPVGAVAPRPWRFAHSVYGPVATVTEQAASALAGPSAARTVFWLKLWNALAYLAVALALDRLLRSDPAARTRAHLMWSVNPLMLWAVLAGGHIDGLAAAAGFLGLLCLRRAGAGRGAAPGLLLGAAIAVKAPFVLFLPGAAWAARRSPRTLAGAALGVVAVLVPAYLLAGRAAINALASRAAGGPDLYQPWQLLTRTLGIHHPTRFTDIAALLTSAVLAVLLVRRLPRLAGPGEPAGRQPDSGWQGAPSLAWSRQLPVSQAAWITMALSLAWLVCSPQQRPWYDAMIFPLLALLPATRLDWIVVARALAAALAEIPGVIFYAGLRPHWLAVAADLIARGLAPLTLVLAAVTLVWLCMTGQWLPPRRAGAARVDPAGGLSSPGTSGGQGSPAGTAASALRPGPDQALPRGSAGTRGLPGRGNQRSPAG